MSLVDVQRGISFGATADELCQRDYCRVLSMERAAVSSSLPTILEAMHGFGYCFGSTREMLKGIADGLGCKIDDVVFLRVNSDVDSGEFFIDLNSADFMIVKTYHRYNSVLLAVDRTTINTKWIKSLYPLDSEDNLAEDTTVTTAYKDNLKHDDDKCRLDLVEPSLIEAVGWIRTFGIKKYPEVYGYKKLEPWRIMGALLRHINAYRKGEKYDKESGYSHLWHAACNLMFLIELEREDNEKS